MVLTTEQKPQIDVIIPVYNGERFIMKALRSVDWQTYEPTQIIVVDDGSTDKTEEEVLAFKALSKIPVQFIKQTNAGPNSARNTGIKASTSSFLAFLDADDAWEKTKLEDQLRVFQISDLTNLGLVYCAYSLINEEDKPINMFTVALDPEYRGNIFKKVLNANKITGSASAAMIKRECFDIVGLFDEKLKASEDWDMWIRISEKYTVDYVSKNLVKIRRHPDNFQKKREYMLLNDITFYNKWIARLPANEVPVKWRHNVAGLILWALPSLRFLPLAKENLTAQSKEVLFGKFGGIEVFTLFSFFKKIRKLPSKLLKRHV